MLADLPGLFWLLLPVAAASGWFIARRADARGRSGDSRILSPDYFKGINYLLNEQPDKAIEVFIRMIEVESDTVETHLALGNLFRRRGEVDRAIRIHQNLIARNRLSGEERAVAVLELGIDYMRSGLLDRAEGLFQQLLGAGKYMRQALTHLIDIYQQEQDWEKAIDTARRLEKVSGKRLRRMIAHFYCEQAESRWRGGELPRAEELIDKALDEDPNCVRANLMAGQIAMDTDHPGAAIDRYIRIEKQDVDYIAEAIEPMHRCYQALGRVDEFVEYLRHLVGRNAGITPVLALAEQVADRDGIDAALEYLSGALHQRPTVRGLDRLIHYALAHAEGRSRDNLILLKELTSKLLENKSIYRCSQCGFVGRLLHWQCPSCKNWNTVKPIHGIEGE